MSSLRAFAGSRRALAVACGHSDGTIEIIKPGTPDSIRLHGTGFDDGWRRLDISADAEMVALAHYYGGVELWSINRRCRVMSAKGLGGAQAIEFIGDTSDMLVESERKGTVRLSAEGAELKCIPGFRFGAISRDGELCFGRGRQSLSLIELRGHQVVAEWDAKSFGIITACFAGRSVVVAEALGWLRLLHRDGTERVVDHGGERWAVIHSLSPVAATRAVVGWGLLPGDSIGPAAELFRIDLNSGDVETLLRREPQFACAIGDGSQWMFADGERVVVA